MKIGLYIGSFNPPHNGHMQIVDLLIRQKVLDKIIIVPTGDMYNKAGLEPIKFRLEMLKLAIEGKNQVEVSDFENKQRLIKTYETLDYFQSVYPNEDIQLIIGADNLCDFVNWDKYEHMIKNYKIIVIKRKNSEIDNIKFDCKVKGIFVFDYVSDLSSTEVRKRIEHKKNLQGLTPPKVEKYIVSNNLYK